MAKELTAAMQAFLEEKRFAALATINPNGTPQQTIMWYELRDNMIVMNTASERIKNQNLKRDQRISVCIADGYTYVTIAGTVRLEDDQQVAQEDIRRLAIRYSGEEEGAKQAEQFREQQRISIYLPVTRVSAYGFDE